MTIMPNRKKPRAKNGGLGDVASRRRKAVRVKAKSQRSESSRQWLQRHLNDPYVAAAQKEGFRSRAAFKLLQLDEKFKLLRPGLRVVDLGAAPGGWTQVTAKAIAQKPGKLIALDILPMQPIEGVEIVQMDFTADDAPGKLKTLLGGSADLVLSDMAPNTTGHAGTDHIRVMALAEMAAHFISKSKKLSESIAVEEIQDIVEFTLMSSGHFKTARAYIVYREKRAQSRAAGTVAVEVRRWN